MMSARNGRTLRVAAMLCGMLALAGCGGEEPTTPIMPPAGASTQAPAPAEVPCGTVAETVKDHLKSSDVVSVTIVGQCTSLVVQTTLGDDDTAGARQLCERAGEVAYTGDVNSVAVHARSGAELSMGIAGMRCLP